MFFKGDEYQINRTNRECVLALLENPLNLEEHLNGLRPRLEPNILLSLNQWDIIISKVLLWFSIIVYQMISPNKIGRISKFEFWR